METVRTYILSVTAAAILCAIVNALTGKSRTIYAIVKLVTGIVMTSVAIQPLGLVLSADLTDYIRELDAQTTAAVQLGTDASAKALAIRIKKDTETYILDKAAELEAVLTVEILVDDAGIPAPVGVILTGRVSPYAKSALQEVLYKDLGIPKEEQIWN